MATIADKLTSKTTGFDYLRIGLAFGVLVWHSLSITLPPNPVWSAARPFWTFLLPSFFALSGFLVAGSLERNRLDTFLTLRALRILPALAVEILLSALLLGPLATTLPLNEYFSDPKFGTYFFNVIGNIHYFLPGVFEHNITYNQVNLSLWTVPFELECYASLALLAALGLHRHRRAFLALAVLAWIALPLLSLGDTFGNQSNISGRNLVSAFLAGVAIYLWRDRIPHSRVLFAICFGLTLFLMSFPVVAILAIWPAAYMTVYLGCTNPRSSKIIATGDYSYGLYLFAFPIQQFLWLTPIGKHPLGNIAGALALSACYAAFSWHCIEKPILGRRGVLVSWVNRTLDAVLDLPRKLKPQANA